MPTRPVLFRLLFGSLVLALALTTVSAPLAAQGAAAAVAATADPGKECVDPPTLAFSRIDNDIYELLVTSEKEKRAYAVQVDYLCRTVPNVSCTAAPTVSGLGLDAPCWSSSAAKTAAQTAAGAIPLLCAVASPSTTRVPIILDHAFLLESGGQMQVTYRAITASTDANCQWNDTGVVPVRALQKHVLNIDLGSVFNLSGDGGWKPSTEVALFSRSEWSPYFVGGFDVRYSAVETTESGNAEEEGDDGDSGDGGEGSTAAEEAEEEAKEPKEFNPFEQKGGVFEATAYGVVRPPGLNWLGLAGGLGFATVPGDDSGDALDARQRYWVAIETSVQGYNAGQPANRLGNTTGFLRFGYMKDDRWEKTVLVPATETEEAVTSDESDRYFVEGEIELPRLGTDAVRFAIRLFASIPESGDGASDVRVSALATVDPRKWFGGGDNGESK